MVPRTVPLTDFKLCLFLHYDQPGTLIHLLTFVFAIDYAKAYTFLKTSKISDDKLILHKPSTYVKSHTVFKFSLDLMTLRV